MDLLFGCTAVVSSKGIDCAVAKLCQLAYRLSPICGLDITVSADKFPSQMENQTEARENCAS